MYFVAASLRQAFTTLYFVAADLQQTNTTMYFVAAKLRPKNTTMYFVAANLRPKNTQPTTVKYCLHVTINTLISKSYENYKNQLAGSS
jgi:hypothetical protein